MGLLRSIGRFFCFFLCCKLEDDEEEEIEKPFLPLPTLHRWHQNQHYPLNAERSPFLYHERPRKDPIPILPVQNSVPTIFISNVPSSKGKEKLKDEVVTIVKSRVVDEGRWTNAERSPFLYTGRPRKDPILPIQNPVPTTFISNEPSSKGKEKLKEEVTIVKSRVVDEGQWTNVESSPLLCTGRPRKYPILPVQNPVPTMISNDPSSKGKEKLKEEATMVKSRVVDEGQWTNVESSRLLYPRRPRKDPILPVQNPVPKEELKKEVMIVKNRVMVDEGRWIKHYSSRHRILLVGEGDFSFSASLAVAFGSASNIIATSLNSIEFLNENYRNAPTNIEKLRSRGCRVMHGIDATQMANHAVLGELKFDRIIFNFPFAGFFKSLSRESQLRRHKRLVSLFMKNAKEMVRSENGEIHISHKTNDFHAEWKVGEIASTHGLELIEAVKFHHRDYPGYNTKCGFGGDNNFNCNPSQTYKFGLIKSPCC